MSKKHVFMSSCLNNLSSRQKIKKQFVFANTAHFENSFLYMNAMCIHFR